MGNENKLLAECHSFMLTYNKCSQNGDTNVGKPEKWPVVLELLPTLLMVTLQWIYTRRYWNYFTYTFYIFCKKLTKEICYSIALYFPFAIVQQIKVKCGLVSSMDYIIYKSLVVENNSAPWKKTILEKQFKIISLYFGHVTISK